MEKETKRLLSPFIGHAAIALTNRCNASLLYALFFVGQKTKKKIIAIPDQGGWLTYKTYPPLLGFTVVEYPTKDAKIDLAYLSSHKDSFGAIIVTNPGAYLVRQPMDELYSLCQNSCLIIEDISGSIGKWVDHSHIKIGSFGRWKPVNAGIGGFISFEKKEDLELIHDLLSTSKLDDQALTKINNSLKNLPARLSMIQTHASHIKKDLNTFDMVNKDEDGLVVIVRFHDESTRDFLIGYCVKKGYEYTICPRNIRINFQAICIEVKRL